ncbi:hypothetical protein BC828DRAFT_137985 [Blastocladiella britannica]|nr:hypothetical protein BC828DRAFT_137985 [Blastocladiella britannica]
MSSLATTLDALEDLSLHVTSQARSVKEHDRTLAAREAALVRLAAETEIALESRTARLAERERRIAAAEHDLAQRQLATDRQERALARTLEILERQEHQVRHAAPETTTPTASLLRANSRLQDSTRSMAAANKQLRFELADARELAAAHHRRIDAVERDLRQTRTHLAVAKRASSSAAAPASSSDDAHSDQTAQLRQRLRATIASLTTRVTQAELAVHDAQVRMRAAETDRASAVAAHSSLRGAARAVAEGLLAALSAACTSDPSAFPALESLVDGLGGLGLESQRKIDPSLLAGMAVALVPVPLPFRDAVVRDMVDPLSSMSLQLASSIALLAKDPSLPGSKKSEDAALETLLLLVTSGDPLAVARSRVAHVLVPRLAASSSSSSSSAMEHVLLALASADDDTAAALAYQLTTRGSHGSRTPLASHLDAALAVRLKHLCDTGIVFTTDKVPAVDPSFKELASTEALATAVACLVARCTWTAAHFPLAAEQMRWVLTVCGIMPGDDASCYPSLAPVLAACSQVLGVRGAAQVCA